MLEEAARYYGIPQEIISRIIDVKRPFVPRDHEIIAGGDHIDNEIVSIDPFPGRAVFQRTHDLSTPCLRRCKPRLTLARLPLHDVNASVLVENRIILP